ncbi:periplasmic heavy metal sensor [Magnetofaba australis]|uniref:Periplasmic heavy metal sensor n=1 Tax=Magnetofaba australis IT-1 TaxID=1434232 RepID=A0A1Y2K1S4_9PROT|nr:periplasmic heavy metal sensor [Magnetofaba australis]OSM00152.1 hypothetical protein MAIT1_00590 [Magnetofaba australis IT-1]
MSADAPRWWRGALFASVGLNLFMATLIGVHEWRHAQHPDFAPVEAAATHMLHKPFKPRIWLDSLQPEQRQMAEEIMARHAKAMREQAMAMRAARRLARDEMMNNELDAHNVERAFMRVRQATSNAQLVAHRALTDVALQLPAAARRDWLTSMAIHPRQTGRPLRSATLISQPAVCNPAQPPMR